MWTMICLTLLIFLLISLGVNIFFFLRPVDEIKFEEAFSIINSIIDNQKIKFTAGLRALTKKYVILGNDGTTRTPNDTIEKYAHDKQELKKAIVKKIVRSLSSKTRKKLLSYYSDGGLIDYIMNELDKNDSSERGTE